MIPEEGEHQSGSSAPLTHGLLNEDASTKHLITFVGGIGMALPTVGMIAGGFEAGDALIGYLGVAALIVFSIIYCFVLSQVLKSEA